MSLGWTLTAYVSLALALTAGGGGEAGGTPCLLKLPEPAIT